MKMKILEILILGLAIGGCTAQAGEPRFTAEVSQNQITLDESVSLILSLETDTSGGDPSGAIQFSAPDFQEVNSYTSSMTQSTYENGQFTTINKETVTKVLRPLKQGKFKIDGIAVQMSGRKISAPPIAVTVGPAGGGTPPPSGYGGTMGLRGAGKRGQSLPFFVKAEINESKLYKGQQLIVSYYLYRRAQITNFEVMKYPVLSGFLREDLDLPVLKQLQFQTVMVDGVAYARALLAQYAAYPLKDGSLEIDPMTLRANYYANNGRLRGEDFDDPFGMFFQQAIPQTSTQSSAPLKVQVQELPAKDRPAQFSGGVGQFTVVSAVDKYEVKVDEPINLTVKVEGRGNLSSLEMPEWKWPEGLELFESKGHAKSGPGGVGEKVFEYLLIPRKPGKIELPALDFSVFDPQQEKYLTHHLDPIILTATGESSLKAPAKSLSAGSGSQVQQENVPLPEIRGPKKEAENDRTFWRLTYQVGVVSFFGFLIFVLFDQLITKKRGAKTVVSPQVLPKRWKKIRAQIGAGGDAVQIAEEISETLIDALEQRVGTLLRGFARDEVRRILFEETEISEALWTRIERSLARADEIRFAKGGLASGDGGRPLGEWVDDAERTAGEISKLRLQKTDSVV